jgi:hypothetical protein
MGRLACAQALAPSAIAHAARTIGFGALLMATSPMMTWQGVTSPQQTLNIL